MKTASPSPARAAKAHRACAGNVAHRRPAAAARRERPVAARCARDDAPLIRRAAADAVPRAAARRRGAAGRRRRVPGIPTPSPRPPRGRSRPGPSRSPGLPHGGFPHARAGDAEGRPGADRGRRRRPVEQERRRLHRRLSAGAQAAEPARRHLLARAGPSQHRGRAVAAQCRLRRAVGDHGGIFPGPARALSKGKRDAR